MASPRPWRRLNEPWRIYRIPDPVKKADKPEAVKFRAEHICRMTPIKFIGV